MKSAGFVLLYAAAIIQPVVSCCGLVRHTSGDLYFFNEQRYMTLIESEELCKSLGGQLPSIHSEADAKFLANIVPPEGSIWLAGRMVSRSPRIYEWTDGSPFDYVPWKSPFPNCEEECCGIAMYAASDVSANKKIFDCSCNSTSLTVCKITMSPASLAERISSVALKVRQLDQDMQSFLSLTDSASRDVSDQMETMKQDDRKKHEMMLQMIAFLNKSIQIDGRERRNTVIVPQQQRMPDAGQQNESVPVYERIATNTVYLVIMSSIIVFLLTTILYKFLSR